MTDPLILLPTQLLTILAQEATPAPTTAPAGASGEPGWFWKEVIKFIIQFLVLVLMGGFLSLFFSYLQNKRTLRLSIINDFVRIHSKYHVVIEKLCIVESRRAGFKQEKKEAFYDELLKECCELEGEFLAISKVIEMQVTRGKVTAELMYLRRVYEGWRNDILGRKGRVQISRENRLLAERLYAYILYVLKEKASLDPLARLQLRKKYGKRREKIERLMRGEGAGRA